MGSKKVFVGLSGGVDSAVTAALLKKAGAAVTGIFIKGWYPPGLPCSWSEDRRDAMRVAAHLAIPFVTLDASKEYKRGVIEYLLAEYRAGRTPNPDVMCNRDVKFGAFYDYAMAHGADHIATGHYARIEGGALMRGKDIAKDQSYFLWAVPRAVLEKALSPLGSMIKSEVRALAGRFGLPVAQKPDSQGICFLGPVSLENFLQAEFGAQAGKAFDESGAHIGAHRGAVLYTVGERAPLPGGPWYVRTKDLAANTLTVTKRPSVASKEKGIRLSHTNWHTESEGEVIAQYRYHGPLLKGWVGDGIFAPSEAPTERPAPGQSIVFYESDMLIGGGIIEE